MKKQLAMILVFVIAFVSLAQGVGAINVIMNSSFVSFPDQEPVVENGTTLVPIRTIAELLGLEVGWDDPTDTVTIKKDNFFIELVIGSTKAKTSSGEKTLPVAPKIINGRTMVPLRFIAEEMGLKVSWNDEMQRVVIAGEVDTQKIIELPTQIPSDAEYEGEGATDVTPFEDASEAGIEVEEEFTDAEVEEAILFVEAESSVIEFVLPEVFFAEDTESEESFAYRTLDGTDSQHTYNWEIVTRYESYADEDGVNGIAFIVQDQGPYEGEIYDVSIIFDEYPEAPERVQVDFGYIITETMRLIIEQICAEKEIEVPEGYEDMSEEELAIALGFESAEEMGEYTSGMDTQALMEQIPEYVEYREWQILNEEYKAEVREIDNARKYAMRKFSDVSGEYDDETWAEFFSTMFNTDPEVRYDGVELIDFDGKKIIHATLYAEDPDDEQGVYDYYYYIDGDCVITIYGGTLFGSEPSSYAMEALSGMTIN